MMRTATEQSGDFCRMQKRKDIFEMSKMNILGQLAIVVGLLAILSAIAGCTTNPVRTNQDLIRANREPRCGGRGCL